MSLAIVEHLSFCYVQRDRNRDFGHPSSKEAVVSDMVESVWNIYVNEVLTSIKNFGSHIPYCRWQFDIR